jgi:hypothetical protein
MKELDCEVFPPTGIVTLVWIGFFKEPGFTGDVMR